MHCIANIEWHTKQIQLGLLQGLVVAMAMYAQTNGHRLLALISPSNGSSYALTFINMQVIHVSHVASKVSTPCPRCPQASQAPSQSQEQDLSCS